MDKVYLTWWQVDRAIFSLADVLREYNPDTIVGISRGGLIPAVRLSHILGDVDFKVIDVKFYKGIDERTEEPTITIPIHGSLEGKRVVIVDDVSDTGKTLQVVIDEVKKRGPRDIKVACLAMKPWTSVVPDFYVFRTDKWIVFPWEEFPVVVRDEGVYSY
ncbi:MAG: phosphoribosyltransferase [Thermococcus sp.]|uniref:phosphoribosyltransferase n=1 Tax=Thermococcus sp. TaxID=35749 RepID=UPI000BD5019D|nr:phosphoribosyltransferase [Thermococcus sp.]OYT32977.1 MAG: xanthine phosphoribosyltransferase [Archaeoglobales archaeon ex4484_92]RLF84177.1 MAG: phosphoribosyltransferase [Thermococci archaeon]MCD6140321.1 phosphoribosyltransferase [Thermococcus sp.]MCD6144733.1 phosphoribosyltransferase [Thermococcus sp.]HDG64366.1 phosphoribosyltransferase [Thermococcus sp.]